VMQTPSPVDGDVRLLFVQLHSTELAELKQTVKHWTLTSLHLLAEFDVIVTMILGHLLSTGFVWTLKDNRVSKTHKNLLRAIVEQQVVCHADSVGLHGMPLTIGATVHTLYLSCVPVTLLLRNACKVQVLHSGGRSTQNLY
uniref:Uncharacterized protein n=1 Tax=Monopterus albus TaxID=43700 RepID=A0A3Q3JA49_MONAL